MLAANAAFGHLGCLFIRDEMVVVPDWLLAIESEDVLQQFCSLLVRILAESVLFSKFPEFMCNVLFHSFIFFHYKTSCDKKQKYSKILLIECVIASVSADYVVCGEF